MFLYVLLGFLGQRIRNMIFPVIQKLTELAAQAAELGKNIGQGGKLGNVSGDIDGIGKNVLAFIRCLFKK